MTDDIQELSIDFLGETSLFGKPLEEGEERSEASEGDAADEEDDDDEEEEQDDEEVSEEEEELEAVGTFEGPSTWEEVDSLDLERVMIRVTSAAMPSTDNKELASRLAMQAAAHEAENSDPLGLGQIDHRQIQLMRFDSGTRKVWRLGRMQSENRRRSGSHRYTSDARDVSVHSDKPLVHSGNLQEMRTKALPFSEDFDPEVFLGALHSNTTMPDLVKGRQNLKIDVSERTGQLKALVKENFDRFISCKNTIDDIHKRLRKSEAHDSLSASGNSTSDMVIAIAEVQEEARKAFFTLLERASTSDQVKSVVVLLKRYEGLFQLPSRIRQSTERGEFDQVISEYRKARSLMDSMGTPSPNSIWHRLFAEAEKVVEEMVEHLKSMLSDSSTHQLLALDAMRYVLQLQADGAVSSLGLEPVTLYTRSRERYLNRDLEDCTERYKACLVNLRNAKVSKALHRASMDGNSQEMKNLLRITLVSPWQQEGVPESVPSVWAAYVKDLSHIIEIGLPDFWHAPQDKLNQLKAVPGALATIQAGQDLGMNIARNILAAYSEKLEMALMELAKDKEGHHFLMALRDIIATFVSYRATDMPPFVTHCLQRILEFASVQTVEQLAIRLKAMTEKMTQHEDYSIIASSHKAGHPASRVPGMLRDVVVVSMTQLEAIIEAAEKADTDDFSFNPIGDSGSKLRQTFFDCFSSYTAAVSRLWGEMAGNEQPRVVGDGLSAEEKLLVLHSNCVHMRTFILKDLMGRYGALLVTNDGGQENKRLLGECVQDIRAVEGRLAKTYIEGRVELLNDMLDEYFDEDGTDWPQAPLPRGLRDSTFEVINILVVVQAEVYGNNLSLQRRVMDEMLQHLFSAYNTFLSERLKDCSVGGILQLLLELQYLSQVLRPMLRPPRDQMVDQAVASILEKIDVLAEDAEAGDEEATEATASLDEWCATIQGGSMGGRAELVAKFKTTDILTSTRLNVASFKA